MKKIIITTDSGCFTNQIVRKNTDVIVIPIGIDGEVNNTYLGGININDAQVLEGSKDGKKFNILLPTLENYLTTFINALEIGADVIHVSTSSNIFPELLEHPIKIAQEISNEFGTKRIHIIDSKQGVIGGEIVIRKIMQMIKEEKTAVEIVDYITNKYIPFIKTSFLAPEVYNFIKGERDDSELTHLERSKIITSIPAKVLNLDFQIDVVESKLKKSEILGLESKKNVEKFIRKNLIEETDLNDIDPSIIVYASSEVDSIEEGISYIGDLGYFENISGQNLTSLTDSYKKSNLHGLSYVLKRR